MTYSKFLVATAVLFALAQTASAKTCVELPNTPDVTSCMKNNIDSASNDVVGTYKTVSNKITDTAKSDWQYTKDYFAHLNGE
jgi:hypothetical protein